MIRAMVWMMIAGLVGTTTAPVVLPVRQTSQLRISAEDLANLDGYLAAPVPMGGNDPSVRPTLVNDKNEERTPLTGKEWLDARREGFTWKSNFDNKLEGWYKQRVYPALWLKSAKPSARSYWGGFSADARIVDWLPARLGFGFDADEAAEFEKRRKRAPVWRDLFPATLVTDRKRDRIILDDTQGGEAVITLLAYGDVNGDGTEDLLMEVATYATQGTFAHVAYVTLTRKTDTGPVEVVKTDD